MPSMNLRLNFRRLLFAAAGLALLSTAAASQTIWVGHGFTFEKLDLADWTLPENSDSIAPSVKLTRKDTQGLFNIAQEDGYSGQNGSPVDTEWATGRSADWEALSFTNWSTWAGSLGGPTGTVGVNAVLHLISDDIYLDIRFLSYSGGGSAGGFAYIRATADTPVRAASVSIVKALY